MPATKIRDPRPKKFLKTKRAIVEIWGAAPYSGSRKTRDKETGETHEEFEQAVWREKIHTDSEGNVFIPGVAVLKALESAASYLSKKVPGKARATFTKRFKAGVLAMGHLDLGVTIEDFETETIFVDAGGGGGGAKSTRVWRTFPVIEHWEGEIELLISDPDITEDVLDEHLEVAGMLIGLGRWRLENGGMNGRFEHTIKSFQRIV